LEGKRCLVVGGGKVAFRKISGLLDAGARVTVVSPELDDRLVAWAQAGLIHHIRREFEETDPDGHLLVFAATGTRFVNRRVLAACRDRHVLCCPVDGNWTDGDFVTPATFRDGNLTVAITTGGRNCRRSRLIKESLSRHAAMMQGADCVVMGVSHQQLDLRDRERFHLRGTQFDDVGRMLRQVLGLQEFMLLNTCNRVELLALCTPNGDTADVLRRIMGFDQMRPEQYYVKRGYEAFEHTALLTAGLLSQMLGENHIVAQVKECLGLAADRGWAGGVIKEWMASALHISKDIRGQMPLLLGRRDVEDVCVTYLAGAVPQLDARIVVIGSGVVGCGLVQRLSEAGRRCKWVYHRNQPDAALVPKNVALHPWKDLSDCLRHADVVFCATASREPVIGPASAGAFAGKPDALLVDLAMPRNIDPALATALPQARLIDLDLLKGWSRQTTGSMEPLMALTRATIQEHKPLYDKIVESFQNRDEGELARTSSDAGSPAAAYPAAAGSAS
jgi:glutamyl-tRNA reductase